MNSKAASRRTSSKSPPSESPHPAIASRFPNLSDFHSLADHLQAPAAKVGHALFVTSAKPKLAIQVLCWNMNQRATPPEARGVWTRQQDEQLLAGPKESFEREVQQVHDLKEREIMMRRESEAREFLYRDSEHQVRRKWHCGEMSRMLRDPLAERYRFLAQVGAGRNEWGIDAKVFEGLKDQVNEILNH